MRRVLRLFGLQVNHSKIGVSQPLIVLAILVATALAVPRAWKMAHDEAVRSYGCNDPNAKYWLNETTYQPPPDFTACLQHAASQANVAATLAVTTLLLGVLVVLAGMSMSFVRDCCVSLRTNLPATGKVLGRIFYTGAIACAALGLCAAWQMNTFSS